MERKQFLQSVIGFSALPLLPLSSLAIEPLKDFTSTGLLFGLTGEERVIVNQLYNEADKIKLSHPYAEAIKFPSVRLLRHEYNKTNITHIKNFLEYLDRFIATSDELWGIKFEDEKHQAEYNKTIVRFFIHFYIKKKKVLSEDFIRPKYAI